MPAHSPPARYDSPWKTVLEHAFRDFFAFFFPAQHTQIDWSKRPRFLDKELMRAGLADDPGGRVADKLASVHLTDGSQQWVLVHVEVQAQRDDRLARRVLDYNYRLFDHSGQPVASFVLLADGDPGWRPQAFHNRLLGTEMGIMFATAKLLDYAERECEMLASSNPFALLTVAHLRTQRTHHDANRRYIDKCELTKLLYQRGWSKQDAIVLFKVINWMMALPEPLEERYWESVRQLERRHHMEWISPLEESFIEKGRQKGLKQGREDGREEGREEGAALLLERMLAERFGRLPQTVKKKLANADMDQLSIWSAALLHAQSLEQVFE